MTTLKWLLIVVGILVVLFTGARLYFGLVTNAGVVADLTNNPTGEQADRVMVLTFPDGRALPVNYLREDDLVFAGADGRWWRALRSGDVPVEVLIRGATLRGHARVVLDDPDYKRDVFARLRPNVPKWLPEWLDGHLVVIELDEEGFPANGPKPVSAEGATPSAAARDLARQYPDDVGADGELEADDTGERIWAWVGVA